jgi:uncharacterized protein with HEPN domain
MSRSSAQLLGDIEARIPAIRQAERLLREAENSGDGSLAATAFDAVLYGLVVLGEAIRNLPPNIRAIEPEVPWDAIIGMRNVVAHEYFRVSAEIVSLTLDAPLNRLEGAIARMRAGL